MKVSYVHSEEEKYTHIAGGTMSDF